MAGIRDRMKKKKQERLLEEGDAEEGVSNPIMEEGMASGTEGLGPSGGESSAETIDETQEADALVKTLKTKRSKKKQELAQSVISPKDDLARELKTAKKRSKQRVDESMRQEQEEEAALSAGEITEDGTIPMPPEEEGEPGEKPEEEAVVTFRDSEPPTPKEEEEESKIKRLRKKKEKVEETPIEGVVTPEEGVSPREADVSPRPPSPVEAEPEMEIKTPRMASIRDKMKKRLQKAKEEAVSEVREEAREERRERRLKDKREHKTTRFDSEGVKGKYDEMEAEELEKLTEERKRQREERKKRAQPQLEGMYMPTAEESFDFFTRNWDPEPEEEEEKEEVEKAETEKKEKDKKKKKEEKKEGEKKEGEEEEEAGPSEEPKEEEEPEATDKPEDEQPLLGTDKEEEGYGIVVVRRAEYPDPTEVEKKEADVLYYPTAASIPVTEKVGEEAQPRFLEDEGFYVGTRPKTTGANQNRMECRLLKEAEKGHVSSRKWFGEDGRMLALPDPLRSTPSRPPVSDEPEPYLETAYRKAVMREYDNRYIDGSTEGGGRYQLDVDINSIVFSHHHLFSREHVLATRLTQLFEQYVARAKKNMTAYLTEKLKALKNSTLHLQDHMLSHRAEHSLTDRANYDRRLHDYKSEIRQTRSLRDKEEQADRTLLKNIIHTWKEIKNQRELQKFYNTPVKLMVRKEETDKTQDQFVWKQEIEDEVEESREEFEEKYKDKMFQYEEQMAKFHRQVEAKKEAAKKLKKKRRRQGSRQSMGSAASGEDLTEEEIKQYQEIVDEADLTEPEKPELFDEHAVREKVKVKAMEARRRPGEPKLHIEMTNTASITPTSQCPRGEQQRRDDVSKCKIFVKVLFNNKEVSRTSSKPLSQDFKVNFGQIYNLRIVQWPESIAYQVYESLGLGNHLMAELCAPIPDISVTSLTVQLEELEFSSDHRISHGHEGVGSGIPFTFGAKGTDLMTLMTTGSLSFGVAWAVDENGTALIPPTSTTSMNNLFNAMKKMDPVAAIGAAGVVDLQKLAKWFSESRLDPNDPNNADIVYMLRGRSGDSTYLMPSEYYRLEQLMEEFDFITEEELKSNKRYQLLELRDGEVQEFRNQKMVPPYEREIPREIFTEYEKKKSEEQKLKQMDDIESHRAAVNRFMQRIREQVMRRFRVLAHMKRLEDVVYEEAVPNIAMIGTSLLKLTERRRPLKPTRKERKKVTAQAIKGDEVKILVNVIRASNIPVRFSSVTAPTGGTMTARVGETTQKLKIAEALVRPYVEVMFQHQSVRTPVGDGPNPSFNEELELPFKAPNDDYSPANLQTVQDTVFLNLFDEVVIDIQEDDRSRGTTVHQRIEKKWLGSIQIPFSTIYFNGKIDGTFRIKSPPVLLGYTYKPGLEGEVDIGLGNVGKTYLTMFITIEPPLTPAEPMKEKKDYYWDWRLKEFTTTEDEKLLLFADTWQAEMVAKFEKKREVKTTVIDVNGKSVFVTRYFKPLKPPEELTSTGLSAEATADLVARYVSMIPFVSDSMIFPGLCDIWSTCDQFLQMLAGDEEEHAVLLTNFFMALGKKAWLVCGSAIPEGPTAYVMTEEASGYWIWNAGTGEHFSTHDSNCPLQSIGCLINNENILANIQQYEKPAQMIFHLNDTSLWEPIFGRRFPPPGLGSIQPEALYYFATDKEYVGELQDKIQQLLKNKIMDWRSRYITRWNRHCTQIMRKLLPVLEENCGKTVGEQHIHELEQSFSSYKVSGFPINMPFTEIDPIVEQVYATGVHAQESSDVEFALAVYIHPYPNSVLSVWVYVASLMRIR